MSDEVTRHGEYAGYQQHRKRGEKPCDDCRRARNEWEAGRRRARDTAAARAKLTPAEMGHLYTDSRKIRDGETFADFCAYVESLIAARLLRHTP